MTAPGWRSVLFALLAFLVLPGLPWALRSIAPVTETWLLLAPALAVCAALGWWNGGGIRFLFLAAALAGWVIMTPVGPAGSSYGGLARGWTLLLAGAFGVVSLLTPTQGFFTRAIAAVGIAAAAAFALAVASPTGIPAVHSVMLTEYGRRTEATIGEFEQMAATPGWRRMVESRPDLDAMVATSESDLRRFPAPSAALLPALIALESLAALGLAWVVYHRLTRVEIGPAMGAIRDFRFNDQLIWGLAVGATIFFLPVFRDGRDAGLNLVVFFGALYLLRGVGVLSWMSRGKWVSTLLVVATIFAPALVGALALGVGVGDTWMDWRSRAQSAT